jgi:hypothetical protein
MESCRIDFCVRMMKRVFFFPDFVVCTLCARLRRICRVHAYGFVLVLTAHIKGGGRAAALVERFLCKRPRLFCCRLILASPREY